MNLGLDASNTLSPEFNLCCHSMPNDSLLIRSPLIFIVSLYCYCSYHIMLECWNTEAKDRPDFSDLVIKLGDQLEANVIQVSQMANKIDFLVIRELFYRC